MGGKPILMNNVRQLVGIEQIFN